MVVDQSTKNLESFSFARILMDNDVFHNIQGCVYLSIEGVGYDIFVKEVSYEKGRYACYTKMVKLEQKVKSL